MLNFFFGQSGGIGVVCGSDRRTAVRLHSRILHWDCGRGCNTAWLKLSALARIGIEQGEKLFRVPSRRTPPQASLWAGFYWFARFDDAPCAARTAALSARRS